MAKIESQGTTISISDDAGVTDTLIKGITSIAGPEASSSEIDITDLDSVAKEFLMGLPDNGSLDLAGFYDSADPGQVMARAAQVSRVIHDFVITYTDATTNSFQGFVMAQGRDLGVDEAVQATYSIRISGAIAEA